MFRSVLAAGGIAGLAAVLWWASADSGGNPDAHDLPMATCKPAGAIRFRINSLQVSGDSIRVSSQVTPVLDLEDVSVRLARGLDEVDVLRVSTLRSGAPLQVSASATLPGLAADRIELRVYASLERSGEPAIAVQSLTEPVPDLRNRPNGTPLEEIHNQGGHSIEVPAERSGGPER